jgi:predicted kinase
MKSPMSKHWSGKGYNSPIQQVNMHTKLKDVPEELINSGKKVVSNASNAFTNFKNKAVNTAEEVGSRISNSTVGDAVNILAGPAVNAVDNIMSVSNTKSNKLMKKLERLPKKNN